MLSGRGGTAALDSGQPNSWSPLGVPWERPAVRLLRRSLARPGARGKRMSPATRARPRRFSRYPTQGRVDPTPRCDVPPR